MSCPRSSTPNATRSAFRTSFDKLSQAAFTRKSKGSFLDRQEVEAGHVFARHRASVAGYGKLRRFQADDRRDRCRFPRGTPHHWIGFAPFGLQMYTLDQRWCPSMMYRWLSYIAVMMVSPVATPPLR